MPLELITIPCLIDNYAFLLGNPETKQAILFDVPEAEPINKVLRAKGWTLKSAYLTHHHPDHVDGISGLDQQPVIIGAAADQHRMPPLDVSIAADDSLSDLGCTIEVIDVPGHTVGHVAFYVPQEGLLFSGDSLMAGGCGRLFEGTPQQMWDSLKTLRTLPPETTVCSGHEYTQTNLDFALSITPDHEPLIKRHEKVRQMRAKNLFTVPSSLSEECATNPFLRADCPNMATAMQMNSADSLDIFTSLRRQRNVW